MINIDDFDSNRVWDAHAARTYDPAEATGMFDPQLLAATGDRLIELTEGGRVLEFAIGTGRVAVPLWQRGVDVSGLELSPDMVEVLRTKATEDEIPVTLGDMSTTRVEGEFSLVYLVFNTISNLLTQAGQVQCFRNAAAHLRPGGRFVIELWVPEVRSLTPGRSAVVFTDETDGFTGPGYLGIDTFDLLNQFVVSHHFHFGEGREATVGRSPHRFIWPSELDLMAQLAGFELEHRWADWTKAEFTAESPSHVSVYCLA
ncbi:class I SAM-dependent DNA methyltransferase [Aestuariimicrobium ganziense]|uniref:class I SAM-dependent DNA methyltransferase n=1 Tax=Aestuariimicrobium ganziense TaxID=2773677 RepID=UPI00194404B0|nr:class I SAM-dependent methyltransferase [Aestuariimicrobium ganziense]